MRTYLFIRRTVLVASLMLIPWVPAMSTYAADPSQGVGTPSQEIPKTIRDAQPSFPSDAPVVGVAPAQATWVDDIMNALGSYFKANYPTFDFSSYVKKLALVRNAVDRGDRRTVKVEMGAFFTMLTNRNHGISKGAADEVANFARIVMPVQEYGIFFPRSGPEQYGTTVPRSWSEQSKEIYSAPSDRPRIPSLPYFPSLGRDG
jgi:hypothetical protein